MMNLLVLLIVLAGLINPAHATPQNLVTVQTAPAALDEGAAGELEISIVVPPGFHVYKDMLHVEVLSADGLSLGAPDLPPGLMKPDPASPGSEREQYDLDAIVQISATSSTPGDFAPLFSVRYQACLDTLCFMPRTEEVSVSVSVRSAVPTALVNSVGGTAAAPSATSIDFTGLPEGAEFRKMDGDKPHPVVARLLSDKDVVAPGSTVRLGVHLEQAEEWHTYWRSPGEVGKPLEITWTFPEGATAAPAVFAIPHRYDVSGIISYGYDNENMLFSEVTLPAGMAAGEYDVKASARWLVCELQCIPGSAELSFPLTVGEADASSRFSPLFDAYAARHPIPAADASGFTVESALSVAAVGSEERFQTTILLTPEAGHALTAEQTEGTWPAFTPIVEGSFFLHETSVQATEAGAVLVTIVAETYELYDGDPLPEGEVIGGLLQVKLDGEPVSVEAAIPLPWKVAAADAALTAAEGSEGAEVTEAAPASEGGTSFIAALGMAFVGGFILNIMPCVLPVLTLKLYSLVGQQDISNRDRQVAGLAYSGGIVASFLALAVGVLVIKSITGADVGWGFQFQYPAYVAALATIVFVFGLSLFGVFEIPAIGANQASEASAKEGLAGYFLTGVFATLLATPCSAPFLGTGMGFALSLPAGGILLFFAVAGLGLAFPFLVIAFVPALIKVMPRPGAWMESFKQLLGFTLIATTVWLVDVLGAQTGQDGMTGFLAFLVFVGIGSWVFGRWGGPIHPTSHQLGAFVGAVVISAAGGFLFLDLEFAEGEVTTQVTTDKLDAAEVWGDSPGELDEIPWVHFTEESVAAQVGSPVFIDFTAEWCLTCKVNEKTILNTRAIRQSMADNGVIPLKADWTNKDETITTWLQRYGKAGVPFYLVIPADPAQSPIPLPEVITPALVKETLAKAAG